MTSLGFLWRLVFSWVFYVGLILGIYFVVRFVGAKIGFLDLSDSFTLVVATSFVFALRVMQAELLREDLMVQIRLNQEHIEHLENLLRTRIY